MMVLDNIRKFMSKYLYAKKTGQAIGIVYKDTNTRRMEKDG